MLLGDAIIACKFHVPSGHQRSCTSGEPYVGGPQDIEHDAASAARDALTYLKIIIRKEVRRGV